MTFPQFADILFRGGGVNAMHEAIRNRRRANASASLLPRVFCFSQGGQFAASREDIRRLPLENYKTVLELLERGHEEISYYIEHLYATMLGVDTRFRGPRKGLRFRRPVRHGDLHHTTTQIDPPSLDSWLLPPSSAPFLVNPLPSRKRRRG